MVHETTTSKKQISAVTVVCSFAFLLSNISYLPFFTENELTQILSYPAWSLIFVTVFLVGKLFLDKRDAKLLLFVFGMLLLLMAFQLFSGKDYFSAMLTKCIVLAMVIFGAGCLMARTERTWGQETVWVYAYVFAAGLLCAVVARDYLAGQDITSRFYSYTSKNETAFLAVSAIVMLLYFPAAEKCGRIRKVLRFVLIAFFTYMVFSMRSRSMMIAEAAIIAVFLFQRNSSRGVKFLVVLGVALLILILQDDQLYNSFITNYLYAGRDANDINDITSGRLIQIDRGINAFLQSPFIGTGDVATVDCFYVSALMQYGGFVGTVFIVLAFYPFAWGFSNYKKIKSPIGMIMILCALTYLIGGMFEENAPFGPGVRCYVSWFLFGYLRVQQARGYFEVTANEKDRAA